MKWVKKIFFGIIVFILGIILLFNIYNFVEIKILKKDLATISGKSILEVISGSMEPTIEVGDLIVIDTLDKDYKENDIVTFYDNESSFVTHRIISINKDEIITKGDNNDSEDGVIKSEQIVGKYKFKIKGLGKIMAVIKKPITMILILIVGVLFCIFFSLDKEGNVIDDEYKKEFEKFKKRKEKQELNIKKKKK